jgi:hypothetical protein
MKLNNTTRKNAASDKFLNKMAGQMDDSLEEKVQNLLNRKAERERHGSLFYDQ